jgi:hypothetical protein
MAQATQTWADGDIFIGFTDHTDSGAVEYIVDIGSVSNLVGNDLTFQLGTDLNSAFGANWNTTLTLQYTVIGGYKEQFGTGGDGYGKGTVFLSKKETTIGTPAAAYKDNITTTTNGGMGDQIENVWGSLTWPTASGTAGSIPNSAWLNATLASSFTSNLFGLNSKSIAFKTNTGGAANEGTNNVSDGAGNPINSASSFFAMDPALGTGNGVNLGTWSFNGTTGELDWTATAAVPEPSTYGLIGIAAGIFLLVSRLRAARARN